MPSPLVTIVTPSFNQGHFLKRTIDSVLRQTYPNIQYLVIDGGSRDETVELLRSYGDRFFWLSEPDGGQSHAINKGMSRAEGEILAYLNSDDVLVPDAVETAVRHFQSHPDWDMIYGEAEYIGENDESLGLYPTNDFSGPRLMQECYICQPAAFWRRDVARKVGPFNETLNCSLDYEYWLRILQVGGTIVRVPELLACSRIYPATKTMSLRERIFREIIRIQQDLYGFVQLAPFDALWHHRCKEKQRGWARKIGWFPLSSVTLGILNYLWTNRNSFPWTSVAGLWRGLKFLALRKWEHRPDSQRDIIRFVTSARAVPVSSSDPADRPRVSA